MTGPRWRVLAAVVVAVVVLLLLAVLVVGAARGGQHRGVCGVFALAGPDTATSTGRKATPKPTDGKTKKPHHTSRFDIDVCD